MKKIFILTGEPSGDKLASEVIKQIKLKENNIEYLCLGGENLKSLNIESISDLKDITYIGITSVLLNIFKIKKIINETVKKIVEFKPDILFSVDSPDFSLRVAEKVKQQNPNIKTIHYVSPQIWVWRKDRIKKYKNFIDHMLLLFKFEKKYYDEENMKSTFVGHPLLELKSNKVDISNILPKDKKIISIFPGSRISEIDLLLPILVDFMKLMNKKYNNFYFVIHSTELMRNIILEKLSNFKDDNYQIVTNPNIKEDIIKHSFFAVSKSGTVSLEISKYEVPSIIIYKMNPINFYLIKRMVKTKFANIINIINQKEIIPELLQSECNSKEIFNSVNYFIQKPEMIKKQQKLVKKTVKSMQNDELSSLNAANIVLNYIKN